MQSNVSNSDTSTMTLIMGLKTYEENLLIVYLNFHLQDLIAKVNVFICIICIYRLPTGLETQNSNNFSHLKIFFKLIS